MEHGAARSSPSVRTTQRETSKRVWRNWQTRMVEGHVGATPWRFESSHPHLVSVFPRDIPSVSGGNPYCRSRGQSWPIEPGLDTMVGDWKRLPGDQSP